MPSSSWPEARRTLAGGVDTVNDRDQSPAEAGQPCLHPSRLVATRLALAPLSTQRPDRSHTQHEDAQAGDHRGHRDQLHTVGERQTGGQTDQRKGRDRTSKGCPGEQPTGAMLQPVKEPDDRVVMLPRGLQVGIRGWGRCADPHPSPSMHTLCRDRSPRAVG